MDEDKIIQAILKNREGIGWIKKNVATKPDLDRMMGVLDTIVKLSERKVEELTLVLSDMR